MASIKDTNHSIISPAIHYWGTPVVLLTTTNEDSTANIAPISSAWWLGRSCVLGLSSTSKTTLNLLRTGECVINLPDDSMTAQVNALARTTGSDPVGEWKRGSGYITVRDKWARAGLHPLESDVVSPQRIRECPVQMECALLQHQRLRPDQPEVTTGILAIEVLVRRVHIVDELRLEGHANRVDPDKWRPLIMSFQHFYGLRDGKIDGSVLAGVEEERYRKPGDEEHELVGATAGRDRKEVSAVGVVHVDELKMLE
jgi:flavin reductase (DIM6/NTAB) family NADH-FMN oxidoreductase RutF